MSDHPSENQIQAWARLVWAGQAVMDAIEADLKAADFPPLYWYDVLLELERSDKGELRPREIAEATLFTRYNVTRLVDRLQKKELVERVPCPDDARGAVVKITDKGRDLRSRMWPVYRDGIMRHFADKLSEDEVGQLRDLLGKLLTRSKQA